MVDSDPRLKKLGILRYPYILGFGLDGSDFAISGNKLCTSFPGGVASECTLEMLSASFPIAGLGYNPFRAGFLALDMQ